MSTVIGIYCDSCGQCGDDETSHGAGTASRIRVRLARDGWQVKKSGGGRDLCVKCRVIKPEVRK